MKSYRILEFFYLLGQHTKLLLFTQCSLLLHNSSEPMTVSHHPSPLQTYRFIFNRSKLGALFNFTQAHLIVKGAN